MSNPPRSHVQHPMSQRLPPRRSFRCSKYSKWPKRHTPNRPHPASSGDSAPRTTLQISDPSEAASPATKRHGKNWNTDTGSGHGNSSISIHFYVLSICRWCWPNISKYVYIYIYIYVYIYININIYIYVCVISQSSLHLNDHFPLPCFKLEAAIVGVLYYTPILHTSTLQHLEELSQGPNNSPLISSKIQIFKVQHHLSTLILFISPLLKTTSNAYHSLPFTAEKHPGCHCYSRATLS